MSRKMSALLCSAVAFGVIGAAIAPAKADDKTDLILRRLDTMEKQLDSLGKENATLKSRLRRFEGGSVAAPVSRAPVVAAPMGPPGATPVVMAAPYPIKAPVAFLCDRYGPGFYGIPGIPGAGGCFKIGGYIRAQGAWGASGDGTPLGADLMAPQGRRTRTDTNDANYDARAVMSMDARIATGWGELRGYARFGAEINTPFGNAFNPNRNIDPVTYWDRGYIEYVGATIGKTRSFFDLFALTDGFLTYGNPRASGDTNLYGVLLAGYTARFGNGFSASLAVEDPNGHNRIGPLDTNSFVMGLGTLGSANSQLGGQVLNQRGYSVPDFVGNLRVDQSWGYAGISGAIHQVAAGYYSGVSSAGGGVGCASGSCFGHPSDRYGWAFSGGGKVFVPGTQGDTVGATAVVSEGATGFATRGALWQLYGGKSPTGTTFPGGTAGFGWGSDGIYDNITPNCAAGFNQCPSSIQLTRAWSINAAYQHIWNPEWKTSAYGSFAAINYNDTAKNLINQHLPSPPAGGTACGVPVEGVVQPPLGVGSGIGNSCSPDYSFWTVGSRTAYTPFVWLELGVDVSWTHLNTAYKGLGNPTALGVVNGVALGPNGGRPAGIYTIADQNVLSVLARAQLSFNP
jgi:hypothetical protein